MFKQVIRSSKNSLNVSSSSSPKFLQSSINTTQKRFRSDIQLDLKFSLKSSSQKEKLLANLNTQGAKLTKENKYQETYFDKTEESLSANVESEYSNKYALALKDIWLFKRDDGWFCRAPEKEELTNRSHLKWDAEERVPYYHMVEGERAIRRELNIQQDMTSTDLQTLEESLKEKGIVPFGSYGVNYKKYDLSEDGKSTLEIYECDFGYNIAKLKHYVNNATIEDLQDETNKLQDKTKELGIELDQRLLEPVLEYIYQNNKEFFNVLVQGSIIPASYEKQRAEKE